IGHRSRRRIVLAMAMLAVTGAAWALTRALMSMLHVVPAPGVDNRLLAGGDQTANNFKLWWQSIAVLGNGDYFGRHLNFTVGLAVVCAVLSIAAVVLLPRIGWRELRLRSAAESDPPGHSVRLAFV